ncbi:MAG: hypothetical protein PHC51_13220 [bacterium]|nr:hypothetical protein [bacterium]
MRAIEHSLKSSFISCSGIRRFSLPLAKVLTFLVFFFGTACGPITNHFGYPGHEIESAPRTPLRIAVFSFEDRRVSKDEGSIDWAYVPLVPTASRTIQKAQPSPDSIGAEYYYPGLVAYALAQDLRKNNVGAVVHLNPEFTDQYDLVITGTLDELGLSARLNTYGLSFLGRFLVVALLPMGSIGADYAATYSISAPGEEPFHSVQLRGDWSMPIWSTDSENFLDNVHNSQYVQNVHAVTKCLEEANEKFVEELDRVIKTQKDSLTPEVRELVYFTSLDPAYLEIYDRAGSYESEGRAMDRAYYQQWQERTSWLKKYQTKEWQRLEKEDSFKHKAIIERLNLLASTRNQKILVLAAEQRAQRAAEEASFGQLADVLQVSAGMAMYRHEHGVDSSSNIRTLAADLGEGLSRVEPVDVPKMPTQTLLADVDREGAQIQGFGKSVIASLDGRTVKELREKFIRLYRSRFPDKYQR